MFVWLDMHVKFDHINSMEQKQVVLKRIDKVNQRVRSNGQRDDRGIRMEVETLRRASIANIVGVPKFIGYKPPNSAFVSSHIVAMEFIPNVKSAEDIINKPEKFLWQNLKLHEN